MPPPPVSYSSLLFKRQRLQRRNSLSYDFAGLAMSMYHVFHLEQQCCVAMKCVHTCRESLRLHQRTAHTARMHTLTSSEPIYLMPSLGMSLHDDGSPFSLLRSIVQLQLLSSLINHAFQVNCMRKHAHIHRACRGFGTVWVRAPVRCKTLKSP